MTDRSELIEVRRRLRTMALEGGELPVEGALVSVSSDWRHFGAIEGDMARAVQIPPVETMDGSDLGVIVLYLTPTAGTFPLHRHTGRFEHVTAYGGPVIFALKDLPTGRYQRRTLLSGQSLTIDPGVPHKKEFLGPSLLVTHYSPPLEFDGENALWEAAR